MRKLRLGLGAISLLFVVVAARAVVSAGALTTIEPHGPDCRKIEGVVGTEDITARRDKGWAYLSSMDRRARKRGEVLGGHIYRLSVATSTLTELTHEGIGLQPHGISLFVDDSGRETLMVVNHALGHSIEIFDVRGSELSHRKTVRHPLLVSPNDVHAIDSERFFATNDHSFDPGLMRTIEDFGQIARGTLVAYDGEKMSVAFEGLAYGNGVQGSLDGKALYVADTIGHKLRVFDRDGMQLALRTALDLGTGVDNIELDDAGRLWIGAHPKLLDFAGHAGKVESRSPSQVLRVDLSGDEPVIEEIYLNDGNPISGSAVGSVWQDHLLIGPVFEPFILDCKLALDARQWRL